MRLERSSEFLGFRIRVMVDVLTDPKDLVVQTPRPKKDREVFEYILSLDDTRCFANAQLSRSELKDRALCILNGREKMWGQRPW